MLEMFSLAGGNTNLSRSAQDLLLRIYNSDRMTMHYRKCCDQETDVRALVGLHYADINKDFYLTLTALGKQTARNMLEGNTHNHGGGFFNY